MDSEEDSNYSSGGEDVVLEEAEENSVQDPYSNTKKDYIILKEDRIKQLQQKDISEVSDLLSVSRGIACTLLIQENWILSAVVEKWLADDDSVREIIAVAENPKSIESDNYCNICLEIVESDNVLSLACGHPFCKDCWRDYLTCFINDGSGCLNLRCPEPKCKTRVGLDTVESLSSEDDRNKYYYYLYRSYIECSRNRKWCPAPGCEYAVEFSAGGCESYDVTCDCSCKFCWKCAEEWHRPVDCETVRKWTKKNKSDGASCTWISAYTKPCPKCQRPIEKSTGCNHMTCGKLCGYEFCWFCLEPWISYAHRCNGYVRGEEQVDSKLKNIRAELIKYSHYYERWAANHKSRDMAVVQMNRVKNEILCKVQDEAVNLLEQCVSEAWEQIVECRRVLKWTFAYGYYMNVDKVKKAFFEYLQGEAESALERLHRCAEKGMEEDTSCDVDDDFRGFRSKLTSLTAVTRNYFQNLVRAIENNLSEVARRKH